jgi:hypothetical protein
VALVFGLAAVVRSRSLSFAAGWLIANAIVGLGWLWWLPVIVAQSRGGIPELAWLAPPTWETAYAILAAVDGPNVYFVHSAAVVVFAAIAVVGLARRPRDLAVAYIAAAAVGITAAEIIISLAGRPVFMERTIVWLAPYFFILVGRAFVGMRAWTMTGAAVVLLAVEMVGVRNVHQKADFEPWRDIVQAVTPLLCKGDVIIFEPYYIEPGFSYYFRRLPDGVSAFAGYIGRTDIHLDPRSMQRPLRNLGRDEGNITAAPRIWLISRPGGDADLAEQTKALLLRNHAIAARHDTKNLSADLFAMDGCGSCATP